MVESSGGPAHRGRGTASRGCLATKSRGHSTAVAGSWPVGESARWPVRRSIVEIIQATRILLSSRRSPEVTAFPTPIRPWICWTVLSQPLSSIVSWPRYLGVVPSLPGAPGKRRTTAVARRTMEWASAHVNSFWPDLINCSPRWAWPQ